MRLTTLRLAIGGLAVAGLLALPGVATGQTPTEDSVSGTSGLIYVGGPNDPLAFEVFARSGASGENAMGTVNVFIFGRTSSFAVTCLNVNGNRAIVGVGGALLFVEDNGGPGTDRFDFIVTLPDRDPTCIRDFPASSALRPVAPDGDYEVLDAQPFPTSKEQCKNGGWQQFGFKNQGDCMRFVATRGKNPPAG